MPDQPTLDTSRLILRPFFFSDAQAVQSLASARAIAATTLYIPHPYEDGIAEAWIETHRPRFETDEAVTFAIVSRADKKLIGAMGILRHARINSHLGELGYWIGHPFWNQGYCTEAARAVVEFGFDRWRLERIFAEHFISNPPSGRVMEKIGMRKEGTLRKHALKWDKFEDVIVYGLLKGELN